MTSYERPLYYYFSVYFLTYSLDSSFDNRVEEKRKLEEKIAAKFFAQQYLGSLHTNVFDMLQDQGYFYDPLQKEIEDIVLVDLLAGLRIQSDGYEAAQVITLRPTLYLLILSSLLSAAMVVRS